MEHIKSFIQWELSPTRSLYLYQDPEGLRPRFNPHDETHPVPAGERWFVENNHYGFMAFTTGIRLGKPDLIRQGLAILTYPLDRQLPDGSFPDKTDLHHSAAFYWEIVARLLILSEQEPWKGHLPAPVRARLAEALAKGARWFSLESSWNDEYWRDAMHHRFLLNASVIELAERALGGLPADALDRSRRWIAEAMKRQRADGAMTELGGHDTGYQALSITFAVGILLACDLPGNLERDLSAAIHRAALWLAGRIAPDGTIDDSGNTRNGPDSVEANRTDGTPKKVKPYEHGFALHGAGLFFHDEMLLAAARRLGPLA